ncbi:hypothetical protein BCR34DRAFT_236786 [Clohesyomyces aquaticus]|uniref:Uncharacterized protein n=1 Tax=Clohesyomyces aquaticus TaxID=1231657 RepID=A0A1Y1Y678_9PLEO|nr:hypothetical protein BCR34DRAFT_236786 [Clohesyomyces aquaticus]
MSRPTVTVISPDGGASKDTLPIPSVFKVRISTLHCSQFPARRYTLSFDGRLSLFAWMWDKSGPQTISAASVLEFADSAVWQKRSGWPDCAPPRCQNAVL